MANNIVTITIHHPTQRSVNMLDLLDDHMVGEMMKHLDLPFVMRLSSVSRRCVGFVLTELP